MARLSWNEIRSNAARFAESWHAAKYERGETQSFYNEFFGVFGISRRRVATFEERVRQLGSRNPGFIDLFWRGTLLVEQKSAGRDLKDAYAQALNYLDGLKQEELPRYLLLSDFQQFELIELETSKQVRFPLADLPKYVEAFGFMIGAIPREFRTEDKANITASELMGELHDALLASGYKSHELERFLVRLVFCMFADDTGIFARGIFADYLAATGRPQDTGPRLAQLFEVLNTPEAQRQAALSEELQAFPYINGDLFAERLPMPSFNLGMHHLLEEASGFHWEEISPAIFGALFQSVMDKKKRRAIGAHYTNEQNILKVLGPLFLDDLHAEFQQIKARKDQGRIRALKDFQRKLASITCFDPACGCGNFLVIAFRELRQLETDVLKLLNDTGQLVLDTAGIRMVSVSQFYGIEIEEFPARIAEVALWMTDHIMNQRLSFALGPYFPSVPLRASPHIHHADALEADWSAVLAPEKCSFILGNPPFIGAKLQTEWQRKQIHAIANLGKKKGTLDYVAAWFLKAGAYVQEGKATIGFVATNSITQGEQVAELWPLLFNRYGLEIAFAHRTFAWGSEARGKANVHVVIIGLTRRESAPEQRRLFDYPDIKGDPVETQVKAISPYLFDAGSLANPHTVVREIESPLQASIRMVFGSMPNEGGHLILAAAEATVLQKTNPELKPFIRRLLGASDFIDGDSRFCLWLADVAPSILRSNPELKRRIEAVRDYRLASKRDATQKLAQTPHLFGEIRHDGKPFVLIPRHSSEKREYLPIGYFIGETIAHDSCLFLPSAELWHFALLTSRMHMSWLRHIGGRLESRYRYSIGIVYNPFPWPDLTPANKEKLGHLAQAVLDARARHAASTLADLYDPLTMPPDLRKAHMALDVAVDRLYRASPFVSDRERVEHLFTRYEALTAPLAAMAKPKGRGKRK